ncbi:hypothetical protein AAW51_2167 [Caldimonas brevitalea]|uniref:Uncharacterized protein n=1 Tax=Caldimonas brevitalea TaxID=413882 RepID=A0A0G3BLJ7_9BURK|nr:hypothetical protein AAW51_2167 [Caldimonas brevitalea]
MLLLAWAFLGVERQRSEFDASYHPFIKVRPTFGIVFVNPLSTDDAYEVSRYDQLDAEAREKFAAFCWSKHGLKDLRACAEPYEAEFLRVYPDAAKPSP